MNYNELHQNIKQKQSFLCVGLDSDIEKMPACLADAIDAQYTFNKNIIDATHTYAVAYKLNVAFYESLGAAGWNSLEKTIKYIKQYYPDIFIIADAKRGDIGNSSRLYARTFFELLDVDAVTVSPFMGEDSIKPFLEYDGKWVIILALTSNSGAKDFQFVPEQSTNQPLYEKIIKTSKSWGNTSSIMYVIGATKADTLQEIRHIIPDHFLLVPGVGKQGGDLDSVAHYGLNGSCGLLVNSSRGIIFADSSENYALTASEKAAELQEKNARLLQQHKIIL